MYTEEQLYWIWLSSVPGMGSKNFFHLMHSYGEAKYVWEELILAKKVLKPALFAQLEAARNPEYLDRLLVRLEESGVQALPMADERYPAPLRYIPDPPPTLYLRGNPDLYMERPFAVVGSRRATRDGSRFARDLCEELARAGVCIISGMAYGIDAAAHDGCLRGEGRTIAVLGCGADVIYPPEHAQLAERILDSGGTLLSEYLPGTQPYPGHFPARNRIISGLSEGVLIVEGAVRSGAMITMECARRQRKPIFAVPGSVYQVTSQGPNQLLTEGAQAVISPQQILSYFNWAEPTTPASAPDAEAEERLKELDEPSRKLMDLLRFEEYSFDELRSRTGIAPQELNALLTMLELQGYIHQAAGKMYRAIL